MDMDDLINEFAIRSFRNTADRDYISARMAYRTHLIPQFLWSALHCLEKYCKCILLLNRIPEKEIGHEVLVLLDKINATTDLSISISGQSRKFIEMLEQTARFRYLENSWYVYEYELIKLDRAVWELRWYCQDKHADVLKAYMENSEPENGNRLIKGGLLESILGDKYHPARAQLVWNNLIYSNSTRKKIRISNVFMGENAPLWLNPEIVDEVKKYIKFPKGLAESYRQHYRNKQSNKKGR